MPALSVEAFRAITKNRKIPSKYHDEGNWEYNPTLHFCPSIEGGLMDNTDPAWGLCDCSDPMACNINGQPNLL